MSALPSTALSAHAASAPPGFELGAARSMIGRRLVLRQQLLGFEPGTPCRVQCVVDFGDGLLLWITTADERQMDVDQIDADDLHRFFDVADAAHEVMTTPATSATASNDAEPWHEPAGKPHGHWLMGALRWLGTLPGELGVSLELARYAERHLSMSDRQLAARGLRREQVMDQIRDRLCHTR